VVKIWELLNLLEQAWAYLGKKRWGAEMERQRMSLRWLTMRKRMDCGGRGKS
jgi:hypothetical protein